MFAEPGPTDEERHAGVVSYTDKSWGFPSEVRWCWDLGEAALRV